MNTPIDIFRQTFDGDKTFFVGCVHIQHKNITGPKVSDWDSGYRNFDSIEEMNWNIIESINKTVKEDDYLFNLGDILFGDKTRINFWLSQIKCKNHYLILGNHCLWLRNKQEVRSLFSWTGDYLEIFCRKHDNSKKLCCLFHYPMKVWDESHKFSYAITSHSHGSLPYTENELGLDVGWDIWRKPISFTEVDKILSKRKFEPKDHHVKGIN